MKKKLLVLASLALAALLLSACGRKTVAPVNVTAAPAPAAEPAPVQTPAPAPMDTPAPAPTLEPTPMITPAPAPTLEPTPMVTPAPAPTATPAPTASNLPRITKDPTGETVDVGGKCQFVTRYENAKNAEWHFVSPDGSRNLDYVQAQKEFPTLKIKGGNTKDMTLDSIPEGLNGWRVYCRFSNDNGSVNSGSALITIQGAKAPAAQRAGFEGRWAEEIAGRCQIVFKYRGEGSMNVDISWSSSAWERARWNMTANVYKNDIMVYNNAHYWVETYTDESHFTTSQDSYNGTGSFYLQDGKLHWANDQTGEDTVFVPA